MHNRPGLNDIFPPVVYADTIDGLDLPVVASGGLADGRGIAAAIAMGAEGFEMGTAFMAGQITALIREERPAAVIIDSAIEQAKEILKKISTFSF